MSNFGAYLHSNPDCPHSVPGEAVPIAVDGQPILMFEPPDDIQDRAERWGRYRGRGGGGASSSQQECNARYDRTRR